MGNLMDEIRDNLQKRERAALEALTESLDDAQVLALSHMDGRTRRGIDVTGVPFQRYSKPYQKRKGGPTRVNLRLTGDMLGDLDVRRDGEFSRTIHLRSDFSNMKGLVHHEGRGRQPRRPWFGLSEDAVDKITLLFRDRLGRAQSSLGGSSIKKTLNINL